METYYVSLLSFFLTRESVATKDFHWVEFCLVEVALKQTHSIYVAIISFSLTFILSFLDYENLPLTLDKPTDIIVSSKVLKDRVPYQRFSLLQTLVEVRNTDGRSRKSFMSMFLELHTSCKDICFHI